MAVRGQLALLEGTVALQHSCWGQNPPLHRSVELMGPRNR